MKLDLTPEQAFVHGTTRQFLDDKVPTSPLRELRDDPAGFGRDFWRRGVAGSGGHEPRTVRQKKSLRRDPWQT
jgi:hypothetical protein